MIKLKKKSDLVVIILGVGVIITLFGIKIIFDVVQTLGWEKVEGTIIGSSLQEIPVPESKTHDTLTPDIVYEYKAGDKYHFSNRISLLSLDDFPRISENYYAGNYEELRNYLGKYRVGERVAVFYNPGDPKNAILDNKLKTPIFLPFITGLLISYCAFHIYVFKPYAADEKKI